MDNLHALEIHIKNLFTEKERLRKRKNMSPMGNYFIWFQVFYLYTAYLGRTCCRNLSTTVNDIILRAVEGMPKT